MTLSILIFRPQIADRCTLKEEEAKVHRAENEDHGESGVDNDLLVSFDGKP